MGILYKDASGTELAQNPDGIKFGTGLNTTYVDGELTVSVAIDNADLFLDSNGNEMLEFTVIAAATNHLGIVNAATGNKPILRAEGEANTGLIIDNSEGEEIAIFASAATSVNETTFTSAATGSDPIISATGDDTNIGLTLTPKGTGGVTISGSATSGNIISGVSGYEAAWFGTAAQQDLSGAGACNITATVTKVTTTGADALTLADGAVKGQVKEIILVSDGGDGTLTPANATGFTTITFADVGDYAKLVWIGTGWIVGATYNVATGDAGPVIA